MDITEIRRRNLESLVDEAGSIRELADRLDIAPSQLSQIRIQYRNMGNAIARRIEAKLGLPQSSMDSLLPAARFKVSDASPHYNTEPAHVAPSPRLAPIINSVAAGHWGSAVDIHPVGHGDGEEPAPAGASDHSFWMRVTGDSMVSPNPYSDSFPSNTLIHIDPEKQWEFGDFVVAKLDDSEEATFKQIVQDAGKKYLKPLNPAYDKILINGNCRIVGKMTESKKKY